MKKEIEYLGYIISGVIHLHTVHLPTITYSNRCLEIFVFKLH